MPPPNGSLIDPERSTTKKTFGCTAVSGTVCATHAGGPLVARSGDGVAAGGGASSLLPHGSS
jgi:hypothetical protein